MTLIELIVAIVVIGICVVSALGLLSSLSMRSAASMTRTQATAIAASYLDEVLAKRFADDGVEASRQLYDDVLDYDGLDELGARNANGALIAGLNQYRVRVNVFDELLPNSIAARRVEVRVADLNDVSIMLSGYRTNYIGQVLY